MKDRISYSAQRIRDGENPYWIPGQFIDRRTSLKEFTSEREVLLPEILESDFINQNGDRSFKEFESAETVALTGFSAEEMRAHGCGISSLYMVLSTLDRNFPSNYPTVGSFAVKALSYHRNDLTDDSSHIVRKGTPVFSLRTGWYHDALLYVAREVADVDVYRREDLNSVEEAANMLYLDYKINPKILGIFSLRNSFWREENKPSSVSTHLVVVNGFRTEHKRLSEVRVTDPYVFNGQRKFNLWVDVNERFRKAFTGRAVFFLKL